MKILLISPYFHPHKGGSQQYAEELHANLIKSDSKVSVDVLTYNTDKSKRVEKYRGFTIYRVPCFQILKGQFAIPNYFELAKTLSTLFKKNRYEFVNSHTRFFETSWWVPFVAKFYKTKSVLTDHCANHPTHKSRLVTKIAHLVDRHFVPLILNRYDHITVTNTATQKFMRTLTKKETSIIYGGVDTKYFKPGNNGKMRKIQGVSKTFSKNDIVVSFVGRMIHSKGPQLLLKAAEEIVAKNKNVYFIFGGNGPLYKDLSKAQSKRIFFLGTMEKKEIAKLLSKTDILVHPSTHHEGFPNVLLEAGAAGCAVVATNMGGTYEIINKNTGILIRPTPKNIVHALDTLIHDRKKRTILGKNLRDWIEKSYDWKQVVSSYKRFITHTVQKPLLTPTMGIMSIPRN